MSGAGAQWLAAIGAALLPTACTTTFDGAVPTRARTADSDTGAAVGSAAASPPISADVPPPIAPPGSGDADFPESRRCCRGRNRPTPRCHKDRPLTASHRRRRPR